MSVKMRPFRFKCRVKDVEHSCRHGNDDEPRHPARLSECITDIVGATKGMLFDGVIKSPANNYQIDISDFDSQLVRKASAVGWNEKTLPKPQELGDIPNIKPDALLTQYGLNITVEIEKSNEKTVWFDFIKLLMLIDINVADFGLLVVPCNYAFRTGKWNLFTEARYYRWCLERFAKVDVGSLSKIAVLGYTQQVQTPSGWTNLDDSVLRTVKEQAHAFFS